MIQQLIIKGLRGFTNEQELLPAIPNGDIGSGLTILVGSNNSGKSTVIEALRAISQRGQLPSFTVGRRNIIAGDRVSIKVIDNLDNPIELRSIRAGSSEVEREGNQSGIGNVYILPSRRTFNPFFGKQEFNRENYTSYQIGFPSQRTSQQDNFTGRLFNAEKSREDFNEVLKKVLNPIPEWSIDQNDNGQYFLKFSKGNISHSSEGVGEGIVSLFFIIDALYDSNPGDVIVIDEPELSLHPSLQKRLAELISSNYATDRQIIIATHSPYFIDLANIANGTKIARVHQKENSTIISQISEESSNFINRSLRNLYNPHVFGLDAKEVFLLDDRIILVEGQDDVVFYKIILEQLGINLNGEFFGWGIGGADNMQSIAKLLDELGFEKVIGIVDADREHRLTELREQFQNYNFFAITANDVRTKRPRPATEGVNGILDEQRNIREEHFDSTNSMFREIQAYLGNEN